MRKSPVIPDTVQNNGHGTSPQPARTRRDKGLAECIRELRIKAGLQPASFGEDHSTRGPNVGDQSLGEMFSGVEAGLASVRSTVSEQIMRALQKVEQGDYGRCDVCKADIPLRRLALIPEATTCVDDADRPVAFREAVRSFPDAGANMAVTEDDREPDMSAETKLAM